MKTIYLENWRISILVDDDHHLNVYIDNEDSDTISTIETGQGDGVGEQLALRFTTPEIEQD
jgi:hypothetical protein